MQQEHVDQRLPQRAERQHVNRTLVAWRDTASAETRDHAAEAVKLLLPLLAEHLALEEARVVPLIESYVTEAEYSRIAAGQVENAPPDKLPLLFGMFIYEAPDDVIDMVVSLMPAEAWPIISDLATQTYAAYAAYAKDLYGTSTPTRSTGQ